MANTYVSDHYAEALGIIYPDAVPGTDYVVRDDGDGQGPYLHVWNLPNPPPTEEEAQAAIDGKPAAKVLEEKETAKSAFEAGTNALSRVDRSVIRTLVKEFNILRKWTRDLKAASAAATNMGTFQAGVANLPTLTDRDNDQVKQALKQDIDEE